MTNKQKENKDINLSLTVSDLVKACAHLGHQKNKRNPLMDPFIYEQQGNLHIIDLSITMNQIRKAVEFLEPIIKSHKRILFVGTKKQSQDAIETYATECDEYYISQRWLGGTLTNLKTIRQSEKKLENIEKDIEMSGSTLSKKQLSVLTKDRDRLLRNLSGIRKMRKLPSLLIVVDSVTEHTAIAEAKTLGIPVIALVDTNSNPHSVNIPIPCNDDSSETISLILKELADKINETKKAITLNMQHKG